MIPIPFPALVDDPNDASHYKDILNAPKKQSGPKKQNLKPIPFPSLDQKDKIWKPVTPMENEDGEDYEDGEDCKDGDWEEDTQQ
jgi:hypothetical protein